MNYSTMRNFYLVVVCLSVWCTSMFAQNVRSIDGNGNNLSNPDWGSATTNLLRMIPSAYADGISSPTGQNRPNPRTISNELFAQSNLLNDPLELSNFIWVYGQFIDHDISLTPNHPSELAMIQVPAGDIHFDPFNTGSVIIPMSRNLFDTNTGVTTSREHPNNITAFVDGSGVYGSDQQSADWLRTFQDGKLKVSSGNNLPFNTLNSEINGTVDTSAPHMDDEVGISPTLLVAGDARANENVLLASFHTLFVREHNRLCDELLIANPSFTDEQLYQKARKIVSGLIQNITFNEWLPTMGVDLDPYAGYRSTVNPGVTNLFSGAAFRLGHTLLTSDIIRLDDNGQVIPEGNLTLKDAFFQPYKLVNEGGIDPLFKGMAQQIQQDFDCKVIDDVRNFLFGPPGAGGLDLAAININRGRERGLPDYNSVRQFVGIGAATDWSDINSDPAFSGLMEDVYGDINEIDPWVGFLGEEKMPNALFGPTVIELMRDQFQRLRDGDRFYFQIDPGLTTQERNEIANTKLADVVRRNTDITIMQGNVFKSLPHDDVLNCSATTASADLNLEVVNTRGVRIQNVDLTFTDGASQNNIEYDIMANGELSLSDLPTCYDYNLALSKQGDYRNGISTYDIILIQSHLLQLNGYAMSPFNQLAGDVDNSGDLDINDMLILRQLLLGFIDDFPAVEPWRFYPSAINFIDPTNPFSTTIDSEVFIELLNADQDIDFIGLKAGDVSGNATVNLQSPLDERGNKQIAFQTSDQSIKRGESIEVPIFMDDQMDLAGFQFTLDYSTDLLDFDHISTGAIQSFGSNNFTVDQNLGTIITSWTGSVEATKEPVFYLHFTANRDGQLKDQLSMSSNILSAEAYTPDLDVTSLSFHISGQQIATTSLEVSAASPNPFSDETIIDIKIPSSSNATMYVSNAFGQQVYQQSLDLTEGINQVKLSQNVLGIPGTYFYLIDTDFGTKQGKLIMIQ